MSHCDLVIRVCLKNRSAMGSRARRAGWRGVTREHIREKSVTEEQRRQPARPAARPPGIFFRHALSRNHAEENRCQHVWRAAFTPLQGPHKQYARNFPESHYHRALKRHKCRAPLRNGFAATNSPRAAEESRLARTHPRQTRMGLETVRRRIEARLSRLASARLPATLRCAGPHAVRHVSALRFLSRHAPRGV